MQRITFNDGLTAYDVPDDFHAELMTFLCSKQLRINQLEDAIRYAKMKAETATKKPTKLTKLEAKHSRAYLYSLVGQNVTQCELYR